MLPLLLQLFPKDWQKATSPRITSTDTAACIVTVQAADNRKLPPLPHTIHFAVSAGQFNYCSYFPSHSLVSIWTLSNLANNCRTTIIWLSKTKPGATQFQEVLNHQWHVNTNGYQCITCLFFLHWPFLSKFFRLWGVTELHGTELGLSAHPAHAVCCVYLH